LHLACQIGYGLHFADLIIEIVFASNRHFISIAVLKRWHDRYCIGARLEGVK